MSYHPTATREKALEALIVAELTGRIGNGMPLAGKIREYASYGGSAEMSTAQAGGAYVEGSPNDYDREHAVDLTKLRDFLNFLIPKLPAPMEEDLSKSILEAIDIESYRAEVKATIAISLPDEDGEIGPVPPGGGGQKLEPEVDLLSNIIKTFNDQFGNIDWKDMDRIRDFVTDELPKKVSADTAYQNAMKNSDKAAARLEHDRALRREVVKMLSDHTELFKQFSDNPSFKKWLSDTIFGLTYTEGGAATA